MQFIDYFREGLTPWPQQVDVLNWQENLEDFNEKRRVFVLSAPPATGKTFIEQAYAAAIYAKKGWRTAYTTPSNTLLSQVSKDFPDWPTLKGASHYECKLFKGASVEKVKSSPFSKETCKACRGQNRGDDGHPICDYFRIKEQCESAPQAIFNSMSYLYFDRETHPFDAVIVDEAHQLSDMLKQMYDMKFWHEQVGYKKGCSGSIMEVKKFMVGRMILIEKLLKNQNQKQDVVEKLTQEYMKLTMTREQLLKKPENFVVEEVEEEYRGKMADCLKIRPILTPKKILNYFFAHSKRVILMSGTMFEQDIKDLGFKNYEYKEVDSPIDISRRKIIVDPVAKVTWKAKDVATEAMAKKIEQLVHETHAGESGVILSTYSQAVMLRQHLTDKIYMFHTKKDKEQVLKEFIESEEPRVAILCGSWEGLNLKDDLARFIIQPIFPVPSWTDRVVQRRIELDKCQPNPNHYYEMEAMKQVIQGSGRASRHIGDHSVVYLLDSKFLGAYGKCKSQLPWFFRNALVWR